MNIFKIEIIDGIESIGLIPYLFLSISYRNIGAGIIFINGVIYHLILSNSIHQKYFWYIDGYLYFPNLAWDAVKVEAIFENDTESCDSDKCLVKQEQSLNIPDYLFSEIEQYVIKELAMTLQVPADGADDGQNTLR